MHLEIGNERKYRSVIVFLRFFRAQELPSNDLQMTGNCISVARLPIVFLFLLEAGIKLSGTMLGKISKNNPHVKKTIVIVQLISIKE